jgi:hypothetical protein
MQSDTGRRASIHRHPPDHLAGFPVGVAWVRGQRQMQLLDDNKAARRRQRTTILHRTEKEPETSESASSQAERPAGRSCRAASPNSWCLPTLWPVCLPLMFWLGARSVSDCLFLTGVWSVSIFPWLSSFFRICLGLVRIFRVCSARA